MSIALPKSVESDPHGDALLQALMDVAQPLYESSDVTAPIVDHDTHLANALKSIQRARRIVRGIDSASKTLAGEQRGLDLVDQRSEAPRGARVSRILVISSDGSEGFYRQVAKLVDKHVGRLLVLRLDATADALGEPLFGPGRAARAILITHKDAVASALLALVPQLTGDG